MQLVSDVRKFADVLLHLKETSNSKGEMMFAEFHSFFYKFSMANLLLQCFYSYNNSLKLSVQKLSVWLNLQHPQ